VGEELKENSIAGAVGQPETTWRKYGSKKKEFVDASEYRAT
jgi:hypothetical protein